MSDLARLRARAERMRTALGLIADEADEIEAERDQLRNAIRKIYGAWMAADNHQALASRIEEAARIAGLRHQEGS